MRRLAPLILLAIGCGGGDRPLAEPPPRAWDRQIAEVRRGVRTAVDVRGDGLRPDDLRDLADGCGGLERLTILHVRGTADRTASDAAWRAVLPHLPNLRRATFDGSVSAAVFAGAGPALTHLNLPAAAANGADLRALAAGQPGLVLLRLHAPELTDDDAAAFAWFPDLRFLHLLDAPLTDTAVPRLAACETLESLYLDRARLTGEGWGDLHARRPDLHLHADLTHPVGGH